MRMKPLAFAGVLMLSGCVSVPPNLFVVSPEQLQKRELETRRYDGIIESELLVASSNVLQDMGYSLENSETALGVLTASKQRDATNGGEVAAAVVLALLGGGVMAMSKDQTIRASLVVRPVIDSHGNEIPKSNLVRITFQRIVTRTDNSTYSETLDSPELYQGFFDGLSKSVFLEAQKV